ncbi:hypothetical protein GCM10018780_07650 [Streptomyces lanatus]|nr:hypothetical protein GCM10018780_07650 [Streptomyces lanatus]
MAVAAVEHRTQPPPGPGPQDIGVIHGRQGVPGQVHDATALAPAVVTVDVTCGCGHTHAGAPEGTTGCGVSFRVELEAESAPSNPLGTP